MKTLFTALRMFFIMTLLTGILYPLSVSLVAQVFMPNLANGSLVRQDKAVVGSELLAQKFQNLEYFWPRPSAVDYNSASSGATNFSWTSENLKKQYSERLKQFGPLSVAYPELLTTSGSGLDPHISPQAAEFQSERVARARHLDISTVRHLVAQLTEAPQFGILGEPRVNVLKLNLALDKLKPSL